MRKHFNIAGPCRPGEHYMLSPRLRLEGIRRLIDDKAYFVVHSPRQTGKTTGLAALAEELTAEGHFAAVLASCKPASDCGDDVERGIATIIEWVHLEASEQLAEDQLPVSVTEVAQVAANARLGKFLSLWSARCPRPVVLFLDEVDSLRDGTLLSVLSQLHAGYRRRPRRAPWSLALIGVRDVRDYKIRRRDDGDRAGTSSPFNIKTASLRLRDFTADEVAELYAQHTRETGQQFTAAATAWAFELTRGQPWLVNALARQAVEVEAPDPATSIDEGHVAAAKETLILRRDTHVDSLIDLLREDRVRRVLQPILMGDYVSWSALDDDVSLLVDLGLIVTGPGGYRVANPIYREIVPRALTALLEPDLPIERASYRAADGRLLFDKLLDRFVDFWRENAEHFLDKQPYSEAAAQLIFMAWLHRIVNGRQPAGVAVIEREYAVGTGRIDLLVRWPLPSGEQERFAIELKVWRDRYADPLDDGLRQLEAYLARFDLETGTLLLFNQRTDAKPLPDRISRERTEHAGRRIDVLRL